ncbi:MAG: ThiF family adenylyltransferase [Armatimonadetes bacterium]|nr:ThiF family adenylyltransferase [Armatimonadota bacterium]
MANSLSDQFSAWATESRNQARVALATRYDFQTVKCCRSSNVEAWRIKVDSPHAEFIRLEVSARFPLELPDVFVEDSGIYGQVPHIDHNLKLCYCDEDTSSVDPTRPGDVVQWVIEQTMAVLEVGEVRPDDFATEFTYYWTGSLPYLSLLRDVVTPRIVEVLHLDQKVSQPNQFLAHEDRDEALRWLKQSTIGRPTVYSRALFLPNLIGPVPPYPETNEDVYALIKANGGEAQKLWEQFMRQESGRTHILSTVGSSRGDTLIGWEHTRAAAGSSSKLHGAVKGFRPGRAPFSMELAHNWGRKTPLRRFDGVSITLDRLVKRTEGASEPRFRHALLIGAGSLGSNLMTSLCASTQLERISIIDPDTLKIENVLRHSCGFDKVGMSKARAVASLIGTDCPWVIFDEISLNVLDCLDKFDEISSTADLVILTTGNDAIETLLLDKLFARRREGQLVHRAWITSGADAGYVVRYQVGSAGCHRCTELPEAEHSEDIRYEPGCSAGFARYGGSRLQRFIAVASDLMLSAPSGPCVLKWHGREDNESESSDRVEVSYVGQEVRCAVC